MADRPTRRAITDWLWWLVPGGLLLALAVGVVVQAMNGDGADDRSTETAPIAAATEVPVPAAPEPPRALPDRLRTATVADIADVFPVERVVPLGVSTAPPEIAVPAAGPIVIVPAVSGELVEPLVSYAIPAAGAVALTVVGEGWDVEPPVFVLPCAPDAVVETLEASCDLANLTPATPEGGAFEVTVVYEVPPDGLIVAAGDASQLQFGAVRVVPRGGGTAAIGSIVLTGEQSLRGITIEGSNFQPGPVGLHICGDASSGSCEDWMGATVTARADGTFTAAVRFEHAVFHQATLVVAQDGRSTSLPIAMRDPEVLAAEADGRILVEGHFFRPRSAISLVACPEAELNTCGPADASTVLVDEQGSFSVVIDARPPVLLSVTDGGIPLGGRFVEADE